MIDLTLASKLKKKSRVGWGDMTVRKRIGKTDPTWLAYNYKTLWSPKSDGRSNFNGGQIAPILDFLFGSKFGSCREDIILKSIQPFVKNNNFTTTNFYDYTSVCDPYFEATP